MMKYCILRTNVNLIKKINFSSCSSSFINMANWNGRGPPAKQFCGNNRNMRFNEPQFLPPPPPPLSPIVVNCGELRDRHNGCLVEIYGRVNKQRLGRFIELKDLNGVTQLVASDNNPQMGKRFLNMPINSLISVIGHVNCRPIPTRNTGMPTGNVEVHVEEILVVKTPARSSSINGQKRSFSTMIDKDEYKGITSTEYKRSKTENIVKYFNNRETTCGELRIDDVNKIVQLIGWLDLKKKGKFMELRDGYGEIQIIINQNNSKLMSEILSAVESDIVMVKGRVIGRPNPNKNIKSKTGEIEVFVEEFKILNPDELYDGPIKKKLESPTQNISTSENETKETTITSSTNLPELNKFSYRTHNCGELTEQNIGENVTICGWLEYRRMRKFITLRDSYGEIQIIISEKLTNSMDIDSLPYESILKCEGKVMARPPGMENDTMITGAIEIVATKIEILNLCKKNLPVEIREFNRSKEQLRLEYRYIDLRFPDMQHNLRLRSNILMKMRENLINKFGFVEVETPTLFRKTPGGAQEFVVPTQKPGLFYSLVQSPQQFKQMLMAGAIDRYFQIARCYRDEATRPNRQPEFTQLDIELSFTNQNEIMKLIEQLLVYCLPEKGEKLILPFPIMTYDDAMETYGSDKPDKRFGMKLKNITSSVILKSELATGIENFSAYAILLKKPNSVLNNSLKTALQKISKDTKSKFYVSPVKGNLDEWKEKGLGKDFSVVSQSIAEKLEMSNNDLLLMAFGSKRSAQTVMGRARLALIDNLETLDLIPKRSHDLYNFLWVVDFPMFTKNEDTGILETTHHPFTAAHPNDISLLNEKKNLENVRSLAYDLVLNGHEIGGGSIRIHDGEMQKMILNDILKIDYNHLNHLIEALELGCPPHGGIALGIDRLLSIICNSSSIREVIAFPKGYEGKDHLSKAPCTISDEEKKIYFIETVEKSVKTSAENIVDCSSKSNEQNKNN